MVGLPCTSINSPVMCAHMSMRQPDATVASTLAALSPPPLNDIPRLTDTTARPGRWVRYIAMVQDIWDMEIYVAKSPDGQSALLVEHAAASTHNDAQLAERLPVYLVSIPGETPWARAMRNNEAPPSRRAAAQQRRQHQQQQQRPQQRLKRTRDDVDMEDSAVAVGSGIAAAAPSPMSSTAPPASAAVPQPTTSARPPAGPSCVSGATGAPVTASAPDKRVKPSTDPSGMASSSNGVPPSIQAVGAIGLNTPVPHQAAASAVVAKLYGPSVSPVSNGNSADSTSAAASASATLPAPRLNSVIEVVGILQDGIDMTQAASTAAANEDDAFAAELAARNPRNVRRVHVVQWRVVPAWQLNPLVGVMVGDNEQALATARREARSAAVQLRRELIDMLTPALLGDALAAEYLLFALLARPIHRESQTLGKLSVNIVLPLTAGEGVAQWVLSTLDELCASVVKIDVSIASMNSVEVFARKDYDLNRLKAGSLQLVQGSCLVANETVLSDGRLSERGVKNIQALGAVSMRGKAPVDFHFYQSEEEVSNSTVLLSKGGKSVIGADVTIRVVEDASRTVDHREWEAQWLGDGVIRKLRLALTMLAEDGEFDISEATTEAVTNAYVEARKNGRAKDGQECLQRWLNVARACARTFGETTLSVERWQYVLQLEQQRDARVGVNATPANATNNSSGGNA